jgi:hypothetical protein
MGLAIRRMTSHIVRRYCHFGTGIVVTAWLERIVLDRRMEHAIIFLIVINAVVLGLETSTAGGVSGGQTMREARCGGQDGSATGESFESRTTRKIRFHGSLLP